MVVINNPISSSPPKEVPLKHAPLVRVVAQVHFPIVASLENRDQVAEFQKSVCQEYPVLREERLVTDVGGFKLKPETIWRFSDRENRWRLSLTPNFLAVETSAYNSRSEFLDRLRDAVRTFHTQHSPGQVDRLGIRYIDRIEGIERGELSTLVRSELIGVVGTGAGNDVIYELSNAAFRVGHAQLNARWGFLPRGATHDPAALEPISEESWILDLDMFTTSPSPFEPDGITSLAQQFSERVYTLFRWAVTDAFLHRYGGQP